MSFVANGRSFSKSASSLSQVHTDTELSSAVASSLAPAAVAAATLTTSNLSASRLHTRATVVRINSTYLREGTAADQLCVASKEQWCEWAVERRHGLVPREAGQHTLVRGNPVGVHVDELE